MVEPGNEKINLSHQAEMLGVNNTSLDRELLASDWPPKRSAGHAHDR
jgi:hypothetical protein